ncbi:hypothetical protein [Robertmurraya massiliosenegalensis]|uniref:hypothetical protein n=1 Tax=Robertmurraya massiliosenegalensis TaxID=1287657 RepID=UPI0002F5A746|nr:hypothetical protein [Robertmurraya massiliosenegalensis]
MEYIVPILLGVSILLFIISFFIKDPYKDLKNELDQFSMQQIQEIYQLKRKIKILEEELLIDDREFQASSTPQQAQKKEIHAIIKNQVWTLAQQGVSIDQIAVQSSLSIDDVQTIIREFSGRDDI